MVSDGMKQVSTTGIVLARTNFGEADRILTVITPDGGKVQVLARGVRKVKSKLAGGIELFSVSNLSFIIGKGEIYTLTSTRLKKHYSSIVKDVNRTMFGYEALKLVNKNTEDEAGEEYFRLLKSTLGALDNQQIDLDLIRLWLELQLLRLGGHAPNLKTDTSGQKLQEKSKYNFDIDNMAFISAPSGRYNAKHIKLLRLGLGLESPAKLAQIKDTNGTLKNCLTLTKIMAGQQLR